MAVRTFAVLCFLGVLSAGCATPLQRARALTSRQQHLSALPLYDALVAERPHDAALLAEREEARQGALVGRVERARAARERSRQEEARAELWWALESHRTWGTPFPPEAQTLLVAELNAQAGLLREEARVLLARGRRLEAVKLLEAQAPLLQPPGLPPVGEGLVAEVAAAARSACEALGADAGPQAPFWSAWVRGYCGRLGVEGYEAGAPTSLRVEGAVEGVPSERQEALRTALAAAFARSPWATAPAPAPAQALLEGHHTARLERRPVTLSAQYAVSAPYQVLESRQVPETSYDAQGRPVTRYHTRSVTVTRYRSQARTHRFDGTAVEADHATRLVLTVQLGAAQPPLVVDASDTLRRTEVEHQHFFTPAHVVPQHASLPSGETWLRGREEELLRRFEEALVARWRESFCSQEAYTLEEAARCAHAPRPWPEAVTRVLQARVGEEVVQLGEAGARP